MPGTLFVVATPIGNLEDITVRALRVLREVSVIAAEDTRRTAHLLARHAITTPMTSLHEHNEAKKAPSIVARLSAGESVAMVSDAGTPTVSDPGQRLIAAAIEAGVRVEPIPGPSAVMTALAASGLPTEPFLFMGFPPVRSKDRKIWFERMRQAGGTAVFFEAPHRIRRTLEDLQAAAGDCRIVIGRELTKIHEQLVRGPISVILRGGLAEKGEFTVVVDLGLTTDLSALTRPRAEVIVAEFGDMTANGRASRRQAMATLASRYGIPTNQIYDVIESSKKSGN